MDGSPPGSSAHGVLQARTLEWVAKSSSRRYSLAREGPFWMREEGKDVPTWHLAEMGMPAERITPIHLVWEGECQLSLNLPSCVNDWGAPRNPKFLQMKTLEIETLEIASFSFPQH